ncbi:MAG: 16S rRNA (uracil(1498)-N(3))-methyltransferase [Cyanobacteriota bacterium]|nr:16S rRNA (uracil(1498)-N(3))-methyltransferase [Cyanobacteriota bacterium]
MVLSECASRLDALPRLAIEPSQIQAEQVVLTDGQAHYLQHVRRLRQGDPFLVFDGSGQAWRVCLSAQPRQAPMPVQPLVIPSRELPISLHLGLAVLKGNGFDDSLRSLTELGVSHFTPLLTARTLVDPAAHKWQRWQKIVREAAEQSERLRIPEVDPPQAELVGWLASIKAKAPSSPIWMAVTRRPAPPLLRFLQATLSQGSLHHLTVLIGPEGGWTEQEVELAIEQGAQPISLGSRILRAVTAPMVVASLVAATLEE